MSPGTGAFAARSNLNATSAPTITDAADKGYGISSRWRNTVTGKEYACTDATVNAAVWIEDAADVTDKDSVQAAGAIVSKSNLSAVAAPTVNDDANSDYAVASRWFDVVNDKEYVCLDVTVGAAVWIETTGAGDSIWQSVGSITKLITAEDIDIQQKELLAAAIETLTAAERGALSPVTAQLCYDTDDSHIYVNV